MKLTVPEKAKFSRCAKAMYAAGANSAGDFLSAASQWEEVTQAQYDRASHLYVTWLCGSESKAAA